MGPKLRYRFSIPCNSLSFYRSSSHTTALQSIRAGRPETTARRPKTSVSIFCVSEFQVHHFMELSKTDIGKL